MIYPNLEEAKKINSLGKYGIIPVSKEIYSDRITPIEVLRKLKHVSSHCYMLESAEDNKRWGRYTFLGYNPTLEFTCLNNEVQIKSGICIKKTGRHPGEYLREILDEYKSPKMEGMPSFTGGMVGYFAYDYIKYNEPTLKLEGEDKEEFKDADLMLFDKVIAFDNYKQKIVIIVNAKTDNIEVNYNKAVEEINNIENLILNGKAAETKPLVIKSDFEKLFSKEEYCEMVRKAKNYIKEGDIFQVVLSNRLEACVEGNLLDTYRVLRTTNPSPYMFYFSSDDVEIAGASPETLAKLENNKLFTYPLAGTRPRGKDETEDEKLEKELLQDEKELSEHNMLVDLERNDLGKISKIGSVKVEKYMNIEKYSHVMHIGSTVSGVIRNDKDAVDAVDSILPAGTLSGAPKVRACEIINELEHNRRGIYGGAIGYIDFTGNLDTCIAIRIAFAKKGKLYVRAGAGIVADSVSQKEFEECINKAKAVVDAIRQAEGGID